MNKSILNFFELFRPVIIICAAFISLTIAVCPTVVVGQVIGTTGFNDLSVGVIAANRPSPLTVTNIDGWNITGATTGGNLSISVASGGAEVGGATDKLVFAARTTSPNALTYVSFKPNVLSAFKLNSLSFRYSVNTSGTAVNTITFTGYKNGSPVAGATIDISGIIAVNNNTAWHTADFTGNTNFNNVDEVRMTTSGGAGATSIMWFDAIDIAAAVSSTPTIATTGTLTAFATCAGAASSAQSVTMTGTNLTADITAAAPTGYEVATTQNGTYSNSVTYTQTSGAASGTLWIRLTSSATGTPSGNIALTSTNATESDVAVSGTINMPPTITLGTVAGITTTATAFNIPYTATTGSPDKYNITTGTTALANFSAVNTATLGTSPVSVTIPASAAGTYDFNLTVTNSTTGCLSAVMPFTLTITAPPTISTTGTLTTLSTTSGTASAATNFNVSGANMTAGILVTPPTGFEVSTTSATAGFGSTVTVGAAGTITSTQVWVRLAAADAANTYSGNITLTSAGATEVDVATVSSTVTANLPIRYVTTIGAGTHDGSSWANASSDLQAMIDASSATNQVWVAAGTYMPAAYPTGSTGGVTNRDFAFSLKADVLVYGGFAGTETTFNQRNWNTNVTILSGDIGTANTFTDDTYHVVVSAGAVGTAALDGFTIRDGYAANGSVTLTVNSQSISSASGAGMYLANSSPVVQNLIFRSNITTGNGGGLYVVGGPLTISNCSFINNSSTAGGGGIYQLSGTTLQVDNSYFDGNNGGAAGGGISVNSGISLRVTNSLFTTNIANQGGAINSSAGNTNSITNCTFYRNVIPINAAAGGAIRATGSTNIFNTIFYKNAYGGFSGNTSGAGSDIIVSGGALTIGYSITQIPQGGTGNKLGVDPLFVNETSPLGADGIFGTADDGLELTNGSPAQDAGAAAVSVTTDVTGISRPQGAAYDMGAYEIPATPTISTTGTLAALSTISGTASSTTTFNVSGTNMTAGILVTAPTGFEVSASANSGFASTVTVTGTGTIASTPVYVRLAAADVAGAYSGNIALTSTDATEVDVATLSSTVKLLVGPASLASATVGTSYSDNVTATAGTGPYTYAVTTGNLPTGLSLTTTGGSAGTVSGTPSAAGTFNFTVTATDAQTLTGSKAFSIVVSPGTPAITYTATASKTYGTADFDPGATSTNNSTGITYSSSDNSVATIVSNKVHIVKAGTVTIFADQAGNSNFNAATQQSQVLTINKIALTVTATGPLKIYGTALTAGAGTNFTVSGSTASSEALISVTLTPDAAGLSATTAATTAYVVTPSAATGTGGFLESNYNITYTPFSGTVSTAALTITANNKNKTYGQSLVGGSGFTAFTPTGLKNGETVGSVALNYGTGAATNAAVGTYTGQITPSFPTGGTFTATNYTIAYAAGDIVIGKAPLTITANTANKTYGQTLTGAAGSAAFTPTGLQNSETVGSVTIGYGTGAAANSSVGTYSGSVTPSLPIGGTFTTTNYNISYATGDIVIGKAPLTIAANTANKTYGQTLTGAASSAAFTPTGLQNSETIGSVTIAYGTGAAANSSVGTYSGSVTPSLPAGGTFTATNYTIAYTVGDIVIGKASLTITANSANKTYGQTLTGAAGSAAFTPTGLQNSETIGSVTISYGTGVAANAAVGTYTGSVTPSLPTGGTFTSTNYNISYAVGDIVIGKAPLTITANTVNKTYGQTLTGAAGSAAFTPTGLQNSETVGSVTIGYGTGAAANAAVGTYTGSVTPSLPAGGTFTSTNYNISYTAGDIIIGTALLTITANTANKTYGQTLTGAAGSTAFTPTGLQNGETIGSVTLAYGTGSAANAAVGTYSNSVTPGFAISGTFTASNYTIAYATGDIVVGRANLTITADNQSKTYGAAIPTLTASYSGFVNGDTFASLTTAPILNTTATTASSVTGGPYAITASGAVAANYNISYASGTLTVGTTPITITATSRNKNYGDVLINEAASALFTTTGLQNGETIMSVRILFGTGSAANAPAGVYNSQVTAVQPVGGTWDPANYSVAFAKGNITVGKTNLTVTATGPLKVYGTPLNAGSSTINFTVSGTLVNGEAISGITLTPDVVAGQPATTAAGTGYLVRPSLATGTSGFLESNYNITYVPYNGIVTARPIIIAAADKSKTYGDADPALTYSITSGSLANNDAFTGALTRVSGEAVNSYAINQGTLTLGSNYMIAYTGANLTIGQKAVTVTAAAQSKTYGAADPTLTYSITNGSLIGNDAFTGVLTRNAGNNVGIYAINQGSLALNTNYVLTYAGDNLTIGPKALTVTADNKSKVYGTANPPLTVLYSGFVNGDTFASLTTQPVAITTASNGSPVNIYPVTPGGGVSSNYTFNYVPGTLTITKAPLTITADNKVKSYTAVNPTLTASYTGFVNGDNPTSLITQVSLTTTATTNSPVGSYPIMASGASSNNYTISYAAGTLTIGNVFLTITADNQSRVYGTVNPVLTVTYSGFVNGDTQANLTTVPTVTTTAAAGSGAGTYTITPSGAVIPGYTIIYNTGTLTVNKAPLIITADNKSRLYGTANPVLSVTYSGFIGNDNASSLTTAPVINTTATTTSLPGGYPVTASGAAAPNYNISYIDGILTITPLTISSLANLAVSSGTLTPVFTAVTSAYTVSVGNLVATIKITPTAADATESINVNGNNVASGSASRNINLNVGANVINTVVTAQDGSITTYTVTVNRAPSSIATLANLVTSDGSLSPLFGTTVLNYNALVNFTTTALSLTPTLTDPTATITVNGTSTGNGVASSLVNLNVGNNTIVVVVTAQDGITTQTYTLIVERAVAPIAMKANNIISPNGDGKNDGWIIKDIELYPNSTVTIFDRAGRVIFSKRGYANDWAGTLKGSPLAEGTYYYLIELGQGTSPIRGFITILRNKR